jgi:hypothetical protein
MGKLVLKKRVSKVNNFENRGIKIAFMPKKLIYHFTGVKPLAKPLAFVNLQI